VKRDPSVLVAIIGETRAWELTTDEFSSNVLDTLDADLALCVRDGEPSNPFYERARYVWRYAESEDWAKQYDESVGSSAWRTLLPVSPQFLAGIVNPEPPQIAGVAILLYYRRLLRQLLERERLPEKYDWLVITRSDFRWPMPHPHVRYLSDRHVYLLDGEQYGGIEDRHAIVPRRYVKQFLSLPDPVFDDPEGLRLRLERAMQEEGWDNYLNLERFLAWRLKEIGLWSRVRYLPYVPFAVRAPGGTTKWSAGVFDEELGCYVKYPAEKERSEIAARFISDQGSWRQYLSPVRGALRRRKLRTAYQERGLYERAFSRPPVLKLWAEQIRNSLDRTAARLGRRLRALPGMPAILDARVRRMRTRADRRDQSR
jgi:hypothetical protein